MNKAECDEMAALVVRLRKQVEIEQARATHESRERHTLVLQLSAHVDALKQSNAQCGEYLRQNEQLHSELVDVRAALALVAEQRDSLKRTLAEWERADTKPHERITADDVADHVVPPVLPMCMMCHHCGNALDASVFGPYNVCTTIGCPRTVTNNDDGEDKSPYNGPCTSSHPVRHE
jgi:hypothetical protein